MLEIVKTKTNDVINLNLWIPRLEKNSSSRSFILNDIYLFIGNRTGVD